MSFLSALRSLYMSKEDALLLKVVRNEPTPVPKDVIVKIQELQTDVLSAQLFNHGLFLRLTQPLTAYEFTRLLTAFYHVMSLDRMNFLLSKLIDWPSQFINRIPAAFPSLLEKETVAAFANQLDWRVSLFEDVNVNLSDPVDAAVLPDAALDASVFTTASRAAAR